MTSEERWIQNEIERIKTKRKRVKNRGNSFTKLFEAFHRSFIRNLLICVSWFPL